MPHNGISRKGFGNPFIGPIAPPPVSPRRLNVDLASLGPTSLLNHPEVAVYTSFNCNTKAYRVTPSLYKRPRYPSDVRPLAVAREEQELLAGTMTRTMPNRPPSPRQYPEPIQLPQLPIPMTDRGVHALVDFMASGNTSPSSSPRSGSQRDPSPVGELDIPSIGSVLPSAVGTSLAATPRRTGKRHLIVHVKPQLSESGVPVPAAARHFRLASIVEQRLVTEEQAP